MKFLILLLSLLWIGKAFTFETYCTKQELSAQNWIPQTLDQYKGAWGGNKISSNYSFSQDQKIYHIVFIPKRYQPLSKCVLDLNGEKQIPVITSDNYVLPVLCEKITEMPNTLENFQNCFFLTEEYRKLKFIHKSNIPLILQYVKSFYTKANFRLKTYLIIGSYTIGRMFYIKEPSGLLNSTSLTNTAAWSQTPSSFYLGQLTLMGTQAIADQNLYVLSSDYTCINYENYEIEESTHRPPNEDPIIKIFSGIKYLLNENENPLGVSNIISRPPFIYKNQFQDEILVKDLNFDIQNLLPNHLTEPNLTENKYLTINCLNCFNYKKLQAHENWSF